MNWTLRSTLWAAKKQIKGAFGTYGLRLLLMLLTAFGFMGMLLFAVWYGPVLIERPPRYPVAGMSTVDLLNARNTARTSLVALIAAVGAIGTFLYTARGFALSRESQLVDRYARAAAQLESSEAALRIGALYSLEQIAGRASGLYLPVREVLIAFVRSRCLQHSPDADAQVAIDILCRNPGPKHSRPVDFRGLNLSKANMRNAVLSNADFSYSVLRETKFSGANLREANFNQADLRGASLAGARIEDARFDDAVLEHTDVTGAKLVLESFSEDQLSALTGLELARKVESRRSSMLG